MIKDGMITVEPVIVAWVGSSKKTQSEILDNFHKIGKIFSEY